MFSAKIAKVIGWCPPPLLGLTAHCEILDPSLKIFIIFWFIEGVGPRVQMFLCSIRHCNNGSRKINLMPFFLNLVGLGSDSMVEFRYFFGQFFENYHKNEINY